MPSAAADVPTAAFVRRSYFNEALVSHWPFTADVPGFISYGHRLRCSRDEQAPRCLVEASGLKNAVSEQCPLTALRWVVGDVDDDEVADHNAAGEADPGLMYIASIAWPQESKA